MITIALSALLFTTPDFEKLKTVLGLVRYQSLVCFLSEIEMLVYDSCSPKIDKPCSHDKVRLSQKILEDFPIAQKCAKNYPGIKNPINGIDKKFIVFNLVQL